MPKPSKAYEMISGSLLYRLETLGKRLRYARLRRNWPQAKVCKMAGVSQTTLKAIESGSPKIPIGMVVQVMSCFKISEEIDFLAAPDNDRIGIAMDMQPARKRASAEHELSSSLVFDLE